MAHEVRGGDFFGSGETAAESGEWRSYTPEYEELQHFYIGFRIFMVPDNNG